MRWHLLSYKLCPAWPRSGSVVAGIGGESLTIMEEGEAEEIRLYGIDCPKKSANFGQGAKGFASVWSSAGL